MSEGELKKRLTTPPIYIDKILAEAKQEFPIKAFISCIGKSPDEFKVELEEAEDKWSREIHIWHEKWLGDEL